MFRRTRERGDTLVILQGILPENIKDRFFSGFAEGETEDSICTMNDGRVAYKILGYARSTSDAQTQLYGGPVNPLTVAGFSSFCL